VPRAVLEMLDDPLPVALLIVRGPGVDVGHAKAEGLVEQDRELPRGGGYGLRLAYSSREATVEGTETYSPTVAGAMGDAAFATPWEWLGATDSAYLGRTGRPSAFMKVTRLEEHIRYAEAHGVLEGVDRISADCPRRTGLTSTIFSQRGRTWRAQRPRSSPGYRPRQGASRLCLTPGANDWR
jgi:hypothetical protein